MIISSIPELVQERLIGPDGRGSVVEETDGDVYPSRSRPSILYFMCMTISSIPELTQEGLPRSALFKNV